MRGGEGEEAGRERWQREVVEVTGGNEMKRTMDVVLKDRGLVDGWEISALSLTLLFVSALSSDIRYDRRDRITVGRGTVAGS